MDNSDNLALDSNSSNRYTTFMDRLTILDLQDARLELRLTRVLNQTYARGFRLRTRRLPNFDVHYIAVGRAVFESDAGLWEAGPGEVVFGSPDQMVGVHAGGPVSLFHCHFAFGGIRPVVVDASLKEWAHILSNAANSAMRLKHALYLPDRLKIGRRDEAAKLFAAMMQAQESHGPGRGPALKAYFLLLLRLVSEEVLHSLLGKDEPLTLGKTGLHVSRALRFIESNLSHPISVRDVAENLQLNPDYFSRVFSRYLGETVGAYILHRRLVVAKDLLVSSGMRIKEVAAAVGFRDPLYFSRVFRREERISPTGYAQEHCEALQM